MTEGFSAGSMVATSPTFIGLKTDTEIALAFRASAMAVSSLALGTAKGMILTVADHAAGLDHREFRQRRNGDGRIDAVQPVDQRLVDRQHAGRVGIEIAAAGEGLFDEDARPGDRLGQ